MIEPCYLPKMLRADGRAWALSIQLYGLRSPRNWGIGDFTDLGDLAETAARAGVAALQINPLHALFPSRPALCSPYSPSSRLFLSPLYIDVCAVPEFASSQVARRLVADPAFQQRLQALRTARRVDYPAVAALKWPLLRVLFGEFIDRHARTRSERYRDFAVFRDQGGTSLADFALFEVLDEQLAGRHPGGWRDWPAAYRDRDPVALEAFGRDHQRAVDFRIYLQWLARTQLDQAQRRARAAGMTVGLIADLAVGSDPAGADAWCDRELLADGVEIGAPPDAFAADGQAWGLPPWRPEVLIERDFRPWRQLLDAVMRGVGGVRIDHIIGTQRQFWVPQGMSGRDGAYVTYPRKALLAILAAASRARSCLVIGEDLGTVPAGFSEQMAAYYLLSTRVLRFERHQSGLFCRPSAYPEMACACAGTHDLVPLAAWLDEDHPGSGSGASEQQLLQAAMVDAGVAPTEPGIEARIQAVHAYLAATPCRLVMVQLEDILAEREPVNRPGTGPEQRNWQRKYELDLADLEGLPAWQATAALMASAGRAGQAVP
ncbi:MAG: 4-alpha-glucanotransferase [Wenzhouxiangella sp.]